MAVGPCFCTSSCSVFFSDIYKGDNYRDFLFTLPENKALKKGDQEGPGLQSFLKKLAFHKYISTYFRV